MLIIISIVVGFIIFGIGYSIGNTNTSEPPLRRMDWLDKAERINNDSFTIARLRTKIAELEYHVGHLSFSYPERYYQFHRIDPCYRYCEKPSDSEKLLERLNRGLKPLEEFRSDLRSGKF